MKIKSFGCSFTYGTDLQDCPDYTALIPSMSTWPALLAKKFGVGYKCYALPGQGNFKILTDLIAQASLDDPALIIVNWTWIDRFDYIDGQESWQTLRPAEDTEIEKFYYRNLHSQFRDMIESAYHINTAIEFLKERKYPFIMTYMDYNLLTPIDPNWHHPGSIEIMQKKISDYLTAFHGKNFLDWSRDRGFKISDNWHPLEQAHRDAAEYMTPEVELILTNYRKEK